MSKILYPKKISRGATIGITAPSSGVEKKSHVARLDLIISQMMNRGFKVKEGKCLRSDRKHTSGSPAERAADFMQLWMDPQVNIIIPPWGGELLIEILPFVDFASLQSTVPKWILGYSDTSTLLFALTLKTAIATAHGPNFMDLIENQVFDLTQKTFEYLSVEAGSSFKQESYPNFQREWISFDKCFDTTFNTTDSVEWKSLRGESSVACEGRLVGGCLDTIVKLVGTQYGQLPEFINSCGNDGTLLYLENCEMPPATLARSLYQMKMAGWFEGINGLLLGRSSGPDAKSAEDLSYYDVLISVFNDSKFPVLYDLDVGHKPPQLLLINGALAQVRLSRGAGSITQNLI